MLYIISFIILFVFELLYFKVADRLNIIDKPNLRSSHQHITLRGGGVVFYFGCLIFFVLSEFQYPWFYFGLTLMVVISFLDDMYTLSNKIRLLFHFTSVILMLHQLDLLGFPWFYLAMIFIAVVGVINAYNFMDGINGITASYSLFVSILLLLVNSQVGFINKDFLIYIIIAILVFTFFNFRDRAKCFAGDVGSVAIAYILLFVLGMLIIKTGNLLYVLFLVVYGVDTVWTIIRRLYRKENIFEAHRSHLYQYLANEAGFNKLVVSLFYGILQFVIGLLVIYFADKNFSVQIQFASGLVVGLSTIYLFAKDYILKKYVLKGT